jgi:acyl carrier protein
MNVQEQVLHILDDVLGLSGRGLTFTSSTHLLGAVPEMDSMAVVSIITAIEERLGVSVSDDDIDGSTFETVGGLVDFVAERLAA